MTEPPDLSRRRFFRSFARDVAHTAGGALGTMNAVNRAAAQAAGAMLRSSSAQAPPAEQPSSAAQPSSPAQAPSAEKLPSTEQPPSGAGQAPAVGISAADATAGGQHSFRVEGDVILVLDETLLPDDVVEIACRSPIDLAREISRLAIPRGPAAGCAAAMSLALAAAEMQTYHAGMRTAILQVRATALLNARVSSQHLRWGVDRLMRRYEAEAAVDEDGDRIARALRLEADAIGRESNEAARRIAMSVMELLPGTLGRPVSILTLGSGAPPGLWPEVMGRARPDLLVHVMEGRPSLRGARVTSVRLAAAGIAHVLIADVSAGALLAGGRIDAIVVGAERIAANGDTTNDPGTSTLAMLAAYHGVPFYVCAARRAVDLGAPDGSSSPIEERDADEVAIVRGARIAAPGTPVLNPGCDITPGDLITAIVTETDVLRSPFGPALASAMDPAD